MHVNLLHTQTIPRPSAKRDEIAVHGGINITEPALGTKGEGFRVDGGVGMHEVGGHADRDLRGGENMYKKPLSSFNIEERGKGLLPRQGSTIVCIGSGHQASSEEVCA